VVERTKAASSSDQLGPATAGGRPCRTAACPPAGRLPSPAKPGHPGALRRANHGLAADWVNGTLGHSAEYDDAHPLAWQHQLRRIPAALALAEREAASGRDLITAVVAGIQCMGLLERPLPKKKCESQIQKGMNKG